MSVIDQAAALLGIRATDTPETISTNELIDRLESSLKIRRSSSSIKREEEYDRRESEVK